MELKKIEGFTPGPWEAQGNGIWKGRHLLATVTLYKPDLSESSEASRTVELIAYSPELYRLAEQLLAENKELKQKVSAAYDQGYNANSINL